MAGNRSHRWLRVGHWIMNKNHRAVLLCNTEAEDFGDQTLTVFLDRSSIGATSYNGSGNKINRLRNLPSGHRCLIHGKSKVHGIGILTDESPVEFLRKVKVVKAWTEEVHEGGYVPLIVACRKLDHFHRFEEPITLEELGWNKQLKPLNGTFPIFPDNVEADNVWNIAVKRAVEEQAKGLGLTILNPFPLLKVKVPLDAFWNLPEDSRSAILLLGLFLNETNWLMRIVAKAAQGLPKEAGHPQLAPEQEAAENLAALMATTLAGKVWEGWDRLCDSKGVAVSILDSLPMSPATKKLKAEFEQKLSTKLFVKIRNSAGFHYDPKHIHVDRLKGLLTNLDTHFFIHPQGAVGFTLSRLSTLALLEAIVGDVGAADRAAAFTDKIHEVLDTTGTYSQLVSGLLIDLIKKEFPLLKYQEIEIPDAPTIDDDRGSVKFFVHPPKDFPAVN
jgi:hypothetical protein